VIGEGDDLAVERFGPLAVVHDPDVLAPREWTLAQSVIASERSRHLPEGPVLELCSGAGQIGLATAVLTGRPAVLVDDDARACTFAALNACLNHVRAEVIQARMEELALGRFPIVLADPPYLESAEASADDDPSHAVDGGADGLDGVRVALRTALRHVVPGGEIVMQVGGMAQAAAVAALAAGMPGDAQVWEVRGFGTGRAVVVLRFTAPAP
jgi:methylase of polypeptide subunit release factors